MAIPFIQNHIFNENNETKEFKAKTALWHYFFDNHNLMLLDEHILGIIQAVDKYNLTVINKEQAY